MTTDETFFTRVGCMDGRIQHALRVYGQKKFRAQYPDTITGPGEVGLLGENPTDQVLFDLQQELHVSVENHHSKGIIVHGHEDCAGNPVSEALHKEQIKKATQVVHSLIHGKITVVGAFVRRSLEDESEWIVEEVNHIAELDPVVSTA